MLFVLMFTIFLDWDHPSGRTSPGGLAPGQPRLPRRDDRTQAADVQAICWSRWWPRMERVMNEGVRRSSRSRFQNAFAGVSDHPARVYDRLARLGQGHDREALPGSLVDDLGGADFQVVTLVRLDP